MTAAAVSVIIPTYNRAQQVGRAVDSVLSQSSQPLEVIVVDDGSTDETTAVLAAYGDKIRVIRQKNQGASSARNTGIKAATGDIISFLDSDDFWLRDKMERQGKLLADTASMGVTCCICNTRMVRADGTEDTSFALAGMHPEPREGIWINPTQILIDRFLLFNQVAAVRRAALDEAGYFNYNLKLMEDYDLALRLSVTGPWAFVADPLVVWHGGSENSLSDTATQLDMCRLAQEILSALRDSSKLNSLSLQQQLQRRVQLLERKIRAIQLTARSNRIVRFYGKLLLATLRAHGAVQRRLPSYPRMRTQQVAAQ